MSISLEQLSWNECLQLGTNYITNQGYWSSTILNLCYVGIFDFPAYLYKNENYILDGTHYSTNSNLTIVWF